MAEFKQFERTAHAEPTPEATSVMVVEPLFEPFDMEKEGGLVRCLVETEDGFVEKVGEAYHPSWAHHGKTDLIDRVTVLPVTIRYDEHGEMQLERDNPEFAWRPWAPTLGSESESDGQYMGKGHRFSEDGKTILLPRGRTEPFSDHPENFQPEGFQWMIEWSADGIAHGWNSYRKKVVEAAASKEEWFERHGIATARPSVYPDSLSEDDILQQSFVQCIGGPNKMRSLPEFAGMSEQHLIGMLSHEAAAHAMAAYQGVQALFNIATEAAPVRDGSFETTFFEHYHDEYFTRDGMELVLPDNEFMRYMFNQRSTMLPPRPHDWREPSRALGSVGAGAHGEVYPADFTEFMRRGDQSLRGPKGGVTLERMLGWHADRYRLQYNAIELCNLATSGGNLRKKLATDEIASKFIVAQQLYYDRMANEQPDNWQKTVNEQQARAVEVGQANNIFAAVSGKETDLMAPRIPGQLDPDETPIVHRKVVAEAMIAFINEELEQFGVPVSEESAAEFIATLSEPPTEVLASFEGGKAEHVFTHFFQPGSKMTANEALQIAHHVQPNLTPRQLYHKYNYIRRQHVFAMESELK